LPHDVVRKTEVRGRIDERSHSLSAETSKLEEELKTCKRQCMDLEDIVEGLKRKEQKLLTDQKKRSEAARSVVIFVVYGPRIIVLRI